MAEPEAIETASPPEAVGKDRLSLDLSGRFQFWVALLAIIILLIFLYFYQPFEDYLIARIPQVHFHNVIFWFASLVAVLGYFIAHWQSFRRHILGASGPDARGLVYDCLQISILVAIIFCAGAILQSVEMLGEHLMAGGSVFDPHFGNKFLAVIVLGLLAVAFFLLHFLIRAIRLGRIGSRGPRRGG